MSYNLVNCGYYLHKELFAAICSLLKLHLKLIRQLISKLVRADLTLISLGFCFSLTSLGKWITFFTYKITCLAYLPKENEAQKLPQSREVKTNLKIFHLSQ